MIFFSKNGNILLAVLSFTTY